jgi:hypothetical protein
MMGVNLMDPSNFFSNLFFLAKEDCLAKEEWRYENLQQHTFAIRIQLICSISNNL